MESKDLQLLEAPIHDPQTLEPKMSLQQTMIHENRKIYKILNFFFNFFFFHLPWQLEN